MRITEHLSWVDDAADVDLNELADLYRAAPLGDKQPESLATVLSNTRYLCFVYAGDRLIGAGRALADGVDCAYIAAVAVHPDYQGRGVGAQIVRRLAERARGHKKIILYAKPGTEGFYGRLGFRRMNTAMAIWHDPEAAIRAGLLSAEP